MEVIVVKCADVVKRQAKPLDMRRLFSLTTKLLKFNMDNISERTILL